MGSIVFIDLCYAIEFPYYSKWKHYVYLNLYAYWHGKTVV